MKAKNRIGLLAKLLGGGFIVSFAFFMFTNATENPLDNNLFSNGYMVADGHKHSGYNSKEDECNPDKGQNCNPQVEAKENKEDSKEDKCNPDKGQNCNPPAW